MMARRTKAAEAARQARARALWQAMTIRHRSTGHVRFDLPEPLRAPEAAAVLIGGLAAVDGIYRVHVFLGAGKLSIRWMEDVCTLGHIARVLAGLVGEAADLDRVPPAPDEARLEPGWRERLMQTAPLRAVRARYDDLKAKADMLSRIVAIKTGKPVPGGIDVQEWTIHFLNDLVAFYLIRQHWDRIIGQWLPKPWAHRYQWLTVVYLTFLLVRYRKGATPKVVKK
ncbi:hypothetical protein CU669_18970 [Paramagnetospirillum kuznetsovii]|uniref:Uncharacterized protein n=1 Tax=Paramagnetospirillum kuznetsovii TaxID=2053833 RepID=A0A364NTA9_9PROT|nr:hypothetical protein [Paramagnetospirillum kuznetsovii]RAU20329.1 hypothetical protein CU669_18970 [Paramagnetospirillum kuznetsovii]